MMSRVFKSLKARLRSVLAGGERERPVSLAERMKARGESLPTCRFEQEAVARPMVIKVADFTMTSYQSLMTLWHQVRHLDETGLQGALVECGTWRGGSSGMMALAHLHGGEAKRELHLFDSFQGLPEPDAAVDGEVAIRYASGLASGELRSIDKCKADLNINRQLMEDVVQYPEHLVRYHVGWFQDTIPRDSIEMGEIALLRLDGDWYESTKICLEHLYPLVKPGGIVVIDDYGKWEGCRKATDEFFCGIGIRPYLHYVDPSARYLFKP